MNLMFNVSFADTVLVKKILFYVLVEGQFTFKKIIDLDTTF